MAIGFITEIEATVKQLGTNGWSQKIRARTLDQFYKKLNMLIGDKEDCPCCFRKLESMSYRIDIRINGGYGKNHETGTTVQINWKGTLGMVTDMIAPVLR